MFQEAGPHCGGGGIGGGGGIYTFHCFSEMQLLFQFFPIEVGSLVPDILGVRDETAYLTLRTNPASEQSPQWPCQYFFFVLKDHSSPPPACLRVFCPEPLPRWKVAMEKKVTARKPRIRTLRLKLVDISCKPGL